MAGRYRQALSGLRRFVVGKMPPLRGLGEMVFVPLKTYANKFPTYPCKALSIFGG